MTLDPRLRADIADLATELGVKDEDLLATLVWIGKRSVGRVIEIKGEDEKKIMRILAFKKHRKLVALEGITEKEPENGTS